MDNQKQQAAERIKQATNILVTVSSNPSVDQLAACIGLTLALNKAGKHATAVFSGAVPSTIEFLQPEKTIEKNTDSLRDFIIALDKSKADKLRYKVEDRVVKIFITPYRTSINEKDLEFSQGDFNVDVVVALGVHNQAELDQAITSHGRILHDATVVTMNVKPGGELGGINWLDPAASSLSELTVQLVDLLDKKLVDNQIATALLTGIVAETERFSNAKTSPQTMSLSAELMSAGANQQLVATKLEAPVPLETTPISGQKEPASPAKDEASPKADDGTLEITHDDKPSVAPVFDAEEPPVTEQTTEKAKEEEKPAPEPEPQPEKPEEKLPPIAPQIHIDEHGSLESAEPKKESDDALLPSRQAETPSISHHGQPPKMILEPPTMGGQLTAAAQPQDINDPGLSSPGEPTPQPAPLEPQSPSSAPVNQDEEMPSGGAQPADSFIVGGTPTVVSPSGQAGKLNEASTERAGAKSALPELSMPPLPPPEPSLLPQPQSEPSEPLPPPMMPAQEPGTRTLSDIEHDVHSGHLNQPAEPAGQPPLPSLSLPPEPALPAASNPVPEPDAPTVDSARDAVAQAINNSDTPDLQPVASLNAQPLDLQLGNAGGSQSTMPTTQPTSMQDGATLPGPAPMQDQPALRDPGSDVAQPPLSQNQSSGLAMPQFGMPNLSLPPTPAVPAPAPASTLDTTSDPNGPPPVPPPMMPPSNQF